MMTYYKEIYPPELEITTDDILDTETHFLDLNIYCTHKMTNIYDKRDFFNFTIVNFPDLNSNIPYLQSYGVFISQLIRYARGCSNFSDFKQRSFVLIDKLTSQNFKLKLLHNSYKKFCDKYCNLINKYGSNVYKLISDYSKK
jgi:hypothetical protein